MKLYGAALSPFVRKVRIALAEKNVPHEFDGTVPLAEAVLALHPQRKPTRRPSASRGWLVD